MILRTLQLLSRGDAGWDSGRLAFGRNTTLLLGPNGCGKTPIIKALAYALGHPVELPPLVRDRCRTISLEVITSDGEYAIKRNLADGVNATVTSSSGVTLTFEDERTFSEWVLPRMGISLRTLSGKNGDGVPPYMSVVGPMFFVDQDTGWAASYVPFQTHQVVKDQREEVVRWLLDVPQRNRPVDKAEFQAAKTTLASIQEQIAFKRHALETLQRELGDDGASGSAQKLEERRVVLEAALARAHSVLESMSQVESAFDVRVREATHDRDQVAYRIANIRRRKAQLVEIRAEVGAELGALEQNEIAAEAFRSLCGNEVCQFFRRPEESYGRRVLYLKDQLKDFESNSGESERELGLLQQHLQAADAAVREAVKKKKESLEKEGGGITVEAVDAASRELSEVRVRLDRLERIARERRQLDALINRELRAGEEVADLRPTAGARRDNSRLLDARHNLAATFKEWLLALRTPNVPADAAFDEELRLIVSSETFSTHSSHSGSTRTRLVLAYHAALIETSLLMQGTHPRLLVLDAPRQHELSAADLRSFIERFYAMAIKQSQPVQLVFSATDAEVVPEGCVDALWTPSFVSDGKAHFLGPTPGAIAHG